MHGGEQRSVVARGRKHRRRVSERLGDRLGKVAAADVYQTHLPCAALREHRAEPLGSLHGTSVYRRAGHQHAVLFRFVRTPAGVERQAALETRIYDRAVQRAYRLHIQTLEFREQRLDRAAVLPHYVEIVAPCLRSPVGVVRNPESALRQGAELSERVGAEEHAFLLPQRHRHLGPVDHGRGEKAKSSSAEIEAVAVFHRQQPPFQAEALVQELRKHLGGLHAEHRLHAGVCLEHPAYEAGVVGFEMVDYEIVGRTARKGFRQVGLPLLRRGSVHGIEDGGLSRTKDIGIVGNPLRNRILALEKVDAEVVDAYI